MAIRPASPVLTGEVAEWFKAAIGFSRYTVNSYRGFESFPQHSEEREATGSLKVSKTFHPGSNPGAPVEGSLNW